MQNTISPFVMVIFGATGDLTARKLMPALYNLLADGILPDRFYVVGMARREFTHDQFKELMREAVMKYSRRKEIDESVWQKLSKNLYFQRGFFEEACGYNKLVELLSSFDQELGACITRFFYLATPPQNYSAILTNLDKAKLDEGCGQGSSKWTRILIEKPFGKDLEQARMLEDQLSETFEERQVYRIDHYLAKETVQNILAFRFANPLEALWNKDHIDHIQITMAESSGIGTRGKFYEGVGALRDVAQNHLMGMLAYTAMEEPDNLTADDIRGRRVEVLANIRPVDTKDIETNFVRGQYGPSVVNGKTIAGYRLEKDVSPDSMTETFVALKLFIDNPRWQGVPFYMRTGKRMTSSMVRIDVQFKNRKSQLFDKFKLSSARDANILSIRIQPREGISLRLLVKTPGLVFDLTPVDMDFSYSTSFKKEIIDSYEKLLLDSMTGDQTLFATNHGYRKTWEYVTNIIAGWQSLAKPEFPNYPAGTWGPQKAQELIEKDGRMWLLH